jgi:hypothetical protein
MNFIEKIKVQKPEKKENSYYLENPGFMDNDAYVKGGITSLKKNNPSRFRFSQMSASPIENEFLNPNAGGTDPAEPTPHYEQIRKSKISNGVVLSQKRRTVNVETGDFPEMFLDLRKD